MKILTGTLRFIGTLIYTWILVMVVALIVIATVYFLGKISTWSPIWTSIALFFAGGLLLGLIYGLIMGLSIPLAWLTKDHRWLGVMATVLIVIYCVTFLINIWFGDIYSTSKTLLKLIISGEVIAIYLSLAASVYLNSKE